MFELCIVSIISSVFSKNLKLFLGIIDNISIGDAIERGEKVAILSENEAKSVLVSMDNLAELSTLPTTVLGKTDVPLYTNTQMIIKKIML